MIQVQQDVIYFYDKKKDRKNVTRSNDFLQDVAKIEAGTAFKTAVQIEARIRTSVMSLDDPVHLYVTELFGEKDLLEAVEAHSV